MPPQLSSHWTSSCCCSIKSLRVKNSRRKRVFGKALGGIFLNMGGIFKDVKFLIFLLIIAGASDDVPSVVLYLAGLHFAVGGYACAVWFLCSQHPIHQRALQCFQAVDPNSSPIWIHSVSSSSRCYGLALWWDAVRFAPWLRFSGLLDWYGIDMFYKRAQAVVANLIFSFGEMAGSPKITEYIGRSIVRPIRRLFILATLSSLFLLKTSVIISGNARSPASVW